MFEKPGTHIQKRGGWGEKGKPAPFGGVRVKKHIET